MKAGRLPKLPSIERLLSKAGARTALQARDPALVEAVYEHWLQRRKADKAGGGAGGPLVQHLCFQEPWKVGA